jgi:hypothetical protein
LRERHGTVLIAATQRADTAVAAVAGDDAAERLPGQEIHQLGEKRFAGVHRGLQGWPWKACPEFKSWTPDFARKPAELLALREAARQLTGQQWPRFVEIVQLTNA